MRMCVGSSSSGSRGGRVSGLVKINKTNMRGRGAKNH